MVEAHYTFDSSNPNITTELVLSLDIQTDSGKVSLINFALKEIKDKTEDVAWIAERLDRIKQALISHKDSAFLLSCNLKGLCEALTSFLARFIGRCRSYGNSSSGVLK